MKPLTVLVLAGGNGSRFWPFSGNKLLWKFGNKQLFQRTVIDSFSKNIDQIVVVTNETNESSIRQFKYPAPVNFVRQNNSNGMADAILTAKELIKDCALQIMIADDFLDVGLMNNIHEIGSREKAFAVIPGWKTQNYFPGGYMILKDKRIMGIVEKPEIGKEPSRYVNISGHYISDASRLLSILENTKSSVDDCYEKALTQLMSEEECIIHEYEGKFQSLKYPWDVLNMMDYMLPEIPEHRGQNIQINSNVVIQGPVYIGDNVKIMEFVKIVGPCYIGDNTIIGNNNVIRSSMIGNNCVTGFNTDITRSFIGDDCWFHSNYLGDSVLEGNISMGSGSVLANLRLDEKEINSKVKTKPVQTGRVKLGAMIGSRVRIGVNTSTMPGVKIGSDSLVGAGLTVSNDIPDNSFVKNLNQLSIEKNFSTVTSKRDQFKNKI